MDSSVERKRREKARKFTVSPDEAFVSGASLFSLFSSVRLSFCADSIHHAQHGIWYRHISLLSLTLTLSNAEQLQSLSQDEKRLYAQLFQLADTQRRNQVAGNDAVALFKRSRLPDATLSQALLIIHDHHNEADLAAVRCRGTRILDARHLHQGHASDCHATTRTPLITLCRRSAYA